ncbi:Nif3-like dinuclear metal center hexameric protein [Segetibacter koreensis]|uniref:Nif3-like dinuclear metal center hexameric protein n=1 Tax=Segetibacter koreensis TaxID=398037 RepID=UPI00036C765C|nr:Nif3-like dinuclear metal center hexameric protein [Segetibacter koreensis]
MSADEITNSPANNFWKRREFVSTLMTVAGVSTFLTSPVAGIAQKFQKQIQELTVQQVIDLILKSIPNAPFEKTVDTIKSGDPDQKVTGIVTTMFATDEVIEKTAKLGANFIIAHEPTFYSHTDDTGWLENDDVYRHKRELLQKHNIAVWRFHDYIHAHRPDGVLAGVLTELGWEKYSNADNPFSITIPPTSFAAIIELLKTKLGIPHLKVIGNKAQSCSRIILAPGAAGGTRQIEAIQKYKPDVFICGELNEWETSEYIRDMRYMGSKTSLIVLGHIVSEEPGLEWLVKWLQPQIPGIHITHIPSNDAFTWA